MFIKKGMGNFVKERYHLHLIGGIALGYPLTWGLFLYPSVQLADWGYFAGCPVGFIILIPAALREVYNAIKYKAPSSLADIAWSFIGGFNGSLIYFAFPQNIVALIASILITITGCFMLLTKKI